MNPTIFAQEPTRTIVLDGLSWRDIALGAALALLAVLLVIALAALREKRRRTARTGRRW